MGLKLKTASDAPYSIVSSQCFETASGTSLTGSISAQAGDIVLATVSVRVSGSTPTPTGWTLLSDTSVYFTAAQNQTLAFFYKNVTESGTVSCVATQAIAGRIYLNLIVVRGASELVAVPSLTASAATPPTAGITAPAKTAGQKLIWGCVSPWWDTSAPYDLWTTTPNDLDLISLSSSTQPRLANFVDDGTGAVNRVFDASPSTDGTYVVIAAVEPIVGYKSSGSAIYGPYDMSDCGTYDNSELSWIASLPTGTSMTIKTAVNDGLSTPSVWDTAAVVGTDTSPVEIPGFTDEEDLKSKYLWIKVEATSDGTATPDLTSLAVWVTGPDYTDKIKVTLPNTGRLKFPQGDVTVKYSRIDGGMEGSSSVLVEDWEEDFTPTGIIPVFNPMEREYISMTPTVTAQLSEVNYISSQCQEYVSLTPTVTATLIHIDDLET